MNGEQSTVNCDQCTCKPLAASRKLFAFLNETINLHLKICAKQINLIALSQNQTKGYEKHNAHPNADPYGSYLDDGAS